ncbi:MAG: UDP-N-acetylmuramate dehydrogenase [Sphaerochaeta sp.]
MPTNVRNRVEKINLEHDVSLAEFSTMKCGGKADLLCYPTNLQELRAALHYAKSEHLPITILGGMSNSLISDEGIEGLVIMTKNLRTVTRRGSLLSAQAGSVFEEVIEVSIEEGLGGLEHYYGIPGSIGGALWGNAGAHNHQISEVTLFADFLDYDGNSIRKQIVSEEFSYRMSPFKGTQGLILYELHFALRPIGDTHTLKTTALKYKERRKTQQQYRYPSLGSIFKNPIDQKAGALLEACGLKGRRIGGAQIANHHANMFINVEGRATSTEMNALITLAKEEVKKRFDITLEEEITHVGRW